METKTDQTYLPMLIGEDTFVITLVLCPGFLYNLNQSAPSTAFSFVDVNVSAGLYHESIS